MLDQVIHMHQNVVGRHARILPVLTSTQQAMRWLESAVSGMRAGFSCEQRSTAHLQRGAKGQDAGTSYRTGGRPSMESRRLCSFSSTRGRLPISPSVYGWRGLE